MSPAEDGVRHQLWVIGDEVEASTGSRVPSMHCPTLYIGDGHHRSAAAARVARSRGANGDLHRHFLAVLFPHHEMTILDYNRVVRDLNGRSPEQFLATLRERFSVAHSDRPMRPAAPGEFGMYLTGRWYRLTIRPELVPEEDPIGRLPITLLTRHVIEPILGIVDPRMDKRIHSRGDHPRAPRPERRFRSECAPSSLRHASRVPNDRARSDQIAYGGNQRQRIERFANERLRSGRQRTFLLVES